MTRNCVLLTRSKHAISSLELTRQFGVTQNTVWKFKHKVMQTMCERNEGQRLRGLVQVDDNAYGGDDRRGAGRGAADRTAFMMAVQVSPEEHPNRLCLSCVRGFRKAAPSRWFVRLPEWNTCVLSDGLHGFPNVCGPRWTHSTTVTRGMPGICAEPILAWVNTALGNRKQSLASTCHAMDAKERPPLSGCFLTLTEPHRKSARNSGLDQTRKGVTVLGY